MKKVLGSALLILLADSAVVLAQRTSVSGDFPIYNNNNRPDLTVDPKRLVSQMSIVDRKFAEGACEIEEGTVEAAGVRRIVRFDVVLINSGNGDLKVGDPTDPNNQYADVFEFAACHGHHHITGFANYQLLNLDGSVAAQGHKQAFCLLDSLRYSNDTKSHGYTCADQGITSGWGDWYYKQLSGQWIDITGVPKGEYIVYVRINDAGTFDEGQNRYPNVIEARIQVPDPRNKVAVDDSELIYVR